jgi:hypothetical protein
MSAQGQPYGLALCVEWLGNRSSKRTVGRKTFCLSVQFALEEYRKRKGPMMPKSKGYVPKRTSSCNAKRQKLPYTNPICFALSLRKRLNSEEGMTQEKLGAEFRITRARVCQYLALLRELPRDCISALECCRDAGLLKSITERRLRRIAAIKSVKEQREMIRELLQDGDG